MAEFTTAKWWEPGKPEKSLSGVLFQNVKRGWLLLLQLDGSFEELPIAAHGESEGPTTVPLTLPNNYAILLGTAGEGRLLRSSGVKFSAVVPPCGQTGT